MAFQKGHPPLPGCETGGRPRKYSTEDVERFADELLIWIKDESKFWLKDFCLEKLIDPNYMHEWAKENDKFGCAYRVCKSIQESRIFKGSMKDVYNSGMSKFALANNHGWSEKQETKVSGDSTNPLTFILDVIDGKSKDLVDGQEE